MTQDELEYGARRYCAPRFTILPLSSGRIAVGRGFNPPDLLHIFNTPEELLAWISARAEEKIGKAQAEAERQASLARASDFSIDLDFDAIDLSEIGL